MDVTLLTWSLVVAAILALVLIDLLTVSRKPHDVMFKEAAAMSVFYIALAVGFGIWVWQTAGSQFGTEYFAAYLVEKSLSVDNLFVFVIIFCFICHCIRYNFIDFEFEEGLYLSAAYNFFHQTHAGAQIHPSHNMHIRCI